MNIKFLLDANINQNIVQYSGWRYLKTYKEDEKSNRGLVASAYKKGKELLMIIRGTDPEEINEVINDIINVSPLNDIFNDISISLGLLPQQLPLLMDFYSSLQHKYHTSSVLFTGHSLGGALAQLMALSTPNSKAVAFDPPGIYKVANNYGLLGYNKPINNIQIFNNYPNLINSHGKHLVKPWQIKTKVLSVYGPDFISYFKFSMETHKMNSFLSGEIAFKPNKWPVDNFSFLHGLNGEDLKLKKICSSYNDYLNYAKNKKYWDDFISGEDYGKNILNGLGNIISGVSGKKEGDLLYEMGNLLLDTGIYAFYSPYNEGSNQNVLRKLHHTASSDVSKYSKEEDKFDVIYLAGDDEWFE